MPDPSRRKGCEGAGGRGGLRAGGPRTGVAAAIVAVALGAGLALGAPGMFSRVAEAAVPKALKCKDAKGRAAGLRALLLLKAFGANKKKSRPEKLAKHLSKAQSKYTKAFSAAEKGGDCERVGDAAPIAATVDEFVLDVMGTLCPPEDPSTTSTTSPPSTTTTTDLPATTSTTVSPTTTTTTTTSSPASTTTTTTTVSSTTTTIPPPGSLVLSEVMYDPSGADAGFEWVELKNAGTQAIDLSTFSLGYGGGDYTDGTAQLAGTVAPGAAFVVGGPASDGSNGNPVYDLVLDFTPDLQNAGTVGDGLALFAVTADQITATTVPVDAVVYGPNNDSGLIDETGIASAPDVGDAPAGSSIERLTAGGTWQIQAVPTPNAAPF
jgi:hypothetical protein